MEKVRIIKRIEHPTKWVTQKIVVVKKNGSMRICLDPINLNKAIIKAHFSFQRFKEISARRLGAKFDC